MKAVGRYWFGIFGTWLLATTAAHADRSMVVLLDASGSMTEIRSDNITRYRAAQNEAASRVETAARFEVEGLVNVAVLQFNSATGTISLSGGTAANPTFVDPVAAVGIINTSSVSVFGTPLADGLCDTIDAARLLSLTTTDRLIEAYTDGQENTSDPTKCGGDPSQTGNPFDPGSWQNKVWLKATDSNETAVQISTTLYTDVTNPFASGTGNSEVGAPSARPFISTLLGFISDERFFAELTAATGGTFTVVTDADPLPVFADVDRDFDVDRDDAIELARQFGAPATRTYDLDASGSIGFSDYAILISRFATGAPDRFSDGNAFTCGNNDVLVLDGLAIEDGGITIDARSKCTITIRNSLIVSGDSAIRIRGAARLTVDNSILVGEGAWVRGAGVVTLSAANSVFHGAQVVDGSVAFTDRGGNVFE